MLLYVAGEIAKMERKKFKVQQIVEQQPEPSEKPASNKRENPKKPIANRKKSSRKK